MSVFGSEYDNACRAAKEYRETRTRDQIVWDTHVQNFNNLQRALARHTARLPQGRWLGEELDQSDLAVFASGKTHAPNNLEIVSEIVSEMERELKALSIIGFREGDAGPKMPELKPIEVKPVQLQRCGSHKPLKP